MIFSACRFRIRSSGTPAYTANNTCSYLRGGWTWRTIFYVYLFFNLFCDTIRTPCPHLHYNRTVFFILFQLSSFVRILTAVNRTELNLVCTDHRISPARGPFDVLVRPSKFVTATGYRSSFKVDEILVLYIQRGIEVRKKEKRYGALFFMYPNNAVIFLILFFDVEINRTNVYANDTNYGLLFLVYFIFSLQFHAIKSVFFLVNFRYIKTS